MIHVKFDYITHTILFIRKIYDYSSQIWDFEISKKISISKEKKIKNKIYRMDIMMKVLLFILKYD